MSSDRIRRASGRLSATGSAVRRAKGREQVYHVAEDQARHSAWVGKHGGEGKDGSRESIMFAVCICVAPEP